MRKRLSLIHILGIATCPINWPIGSGKGFQGVYDREKKCVIAYSDTEKGTKEGTSTEIPIQDEEHLKELIGEDAVSYTHLDVYKRQVA